MDGAERRGAHQLTDTERPATRGLDLGAGKPPSSRRGRRPGSASRRTEEHRSAGGLIVRGAEILLISVMNGKRWQLPKGHIEKGETPEETAVREVREETGVTGRVRSPLPGVEYWFVDRGRQRVHKTVHYFLLDYVSGDAADYDRHEVSGAEWMSWDEGIARLTFENERKAVQAARAAVDTLPPLPHAGGERV